MHGIVRIDGLKISSINSNLGKCSILTKSSRSGLLVGIIFLFFSLIWEFFSSGLVMVFHWCLSDSKSHWISKTLLGILADLNMAVVWMISIRSLISKPSSPYTNTKRTEYYWYHRHFQIL